ncbi:MAG TPA: SRPBCC family protein [Chitinophagaceae bacterium]|nr:SRPBCC family protein [Chitinophagaceae bacterium]
MRLLRLVIFSLLALFLVVTGISLFIPAHVRISRAVNLAPGSDSVLRRIRDARQWPAWYPGLADSGSQSFRVQDSSHVDLEGTQITLRQPGPDEVQAEYRSGNRRPVLGAWKLIRYGGSDSLTLQWYMDFHLRWYPWEKFFSLVYDKMYGTRMEQGLNRLKK